MHLLIEEFRSRIASITPDSSVLSVNELREEIESSPLLPDDKGVLLEQLAEAFLNNGNDKK